MIEIAAENELRHLLDDYENFSDRIIEMELTLQDNPQFKVYQHAIEQKNRLETMLKNRLKEIECPMLEGRQFRFVYEPRVSRSRLYDIEKIKLNERLRNQVLIVSVDEKAFQALEKANVIPDPTAYYAVSEKVTKAVKIELIGKES